MDKERIYTFITRETVEGTMALIIQRLDHITQGSANEAIALASQYAELSAICDEFKKDAVEQA